jgi:hypothetical protein
MKEANSKNALCDFFVLQTTEHCLPVVGNQKQLCPLILQLWDLKPFIKFLRNVLGTGESGTEN